MKNHESKSLDLGLAIPFIISSIGSLSSNESRNDPTPCYQGENIDLSQYDINWLSLAGDRPVNIYHIHTGVLPCLYEVINLMGGSFSKRGELSYRAKVLNKIIRGGSPYGQNLILSQKIKIHGYSKIYSEQAVNNTALGKKGKRKSHGYGGKVSTTHPALGYILASNADQVVTFYDKTLNDFFSFILAQPYVVYENSVSKYLFYDRSEKFDQIRDFVMNFKFKNHE